MVEGYTAVKMKFPGVIPRSGTTIGDLAFEIVQVISAIVKPELCSNRSVKVGPSRLAGQILMRSHDGMRLDLFVS